MRAISPSFVRLTFLLFFVLASMPAGPTAAQTDPIFSATFEVGDLSEWSAFFPPLPPSISSSAPMQGEGSVALGRETIFELSDLIDETTVMSAAVYAESDGVPLPGTLRVSEDRLRITLFFDDPLPDESVVQVFVEGDLLRGANGQLVDANGDGLPGGRWALAFRTLTLETVIGTRVCGRVLASAQAEGQEVPLVGVTVSVDEAEAEYTAVTDEMGNYCLDPAPSERFFVHIDGTTATNSVPKGTYYPTVGKAFEPIEGLTVHVGESYLPLIGAGTLQAVSEAQDTVIALPAEVLADHPELVGSELVVPAGSLYFDDGLPGQEAGIAPVPSDRLPGQLPADYDFPVVLTVQTDGASNLDVPAPVCFPNLPGRRTGKVLAAGTSQGLLSFDHDAGRWRSVGSMTVTGDASLICSDVGSGIRAPGWHLPAEAPVQSQPAPTPLPKRGPDPEHEVEPVLPEAPADATLPPDQPAGCPQGLDRCQQECLETEPVCKASKALARWECGRLYTRQGGDIFTESVCAIGEAIGLVNCDVGTNSCFSNCDTRCGVRGGVIKPRPSLGEPPPDPIFEEIEALGIQIVDLLRPYFFLGAELPPEVDSQLDALLAAGDTAAGGDADAYVQGVARDRWLARGGAMPPGNSPHYPILYLADLVRDGDGLEPIQLRGLTGPYGQFTIFPPNGSILRRIRFYDPYTHAFGIEYPVLLEDGSYGVSRFYLHPVDDTAADFDGDLLVDVVEAIYGSDPTRADSDGDGVSDRDEVIQETDLLGRDIDIGPVISGEIGEAGELDRLSFAAVAGQRAFFDIQSGGNLTLDWMVMDADGDTVFDRSFFSDAGTQELTRGGKYTLYLGEEGSTATGPYTFQIWDVPDPDTFAIAIGDIVSDGVPGPGAGNIESPGREDIYTFDATAGTRIFADLLAGGGLPWDWRLEAPDGTVIFDRSFFSDAGTYLLPQTGTYELRIGELDSDDSGTYSFRLWDVPDPETFTIDIGDVISDGMPAPGAGNIESPGSEDIYSFDGVAGQSILGDVLAGGSLSLDWRLEAPDGTVVFDRSFFSDTGPHVLPQTGTYVLNVGDPDSDHFGTYSFQLVLSHP